MTDTKDDGAAMRDSLAGGLMGLRRSRVSANEAEPTRTWNAQDWAEDQRYIDALDAIGKGLKRDALTMLVKLYKEDPGHLFGRAMLLTLAVENGNEAIAREHLEWAIGFHAQQGRGQEACEAYRSARAAFPELAWNEKPLVQVLVCADRCGDRRAVVDATKFLYASYPQSAALPKAFLASAAVQEAEGRSDLAKATLEAIVQRFGLDPIATLAQRKLRELAGAAEARPVAPSGQPGRASTVVAVPPRVAKLPNIVAPPPNMVAPPPEIVAAPPDIAAMLPNVSAPTQAQGHHLPSIRPELMTEAVARPAPEERMSLLEQATRAPLLPVSDEPWEASLPDLPAPMPPVDRAVSPAGPPASLAPMPEMASAWAAHPPEPPTPAVEVSEQAFSTSLPDLSRPEPEPAPQLPIELAAERTRVAKAAKEARASRPRRTRPDPRVDPESQPAGPLPDSRDSTVDVPRAPRVPRR